MDNEAKLTELIARYPNRWRQAVTNPALRGWFVNKMTGRGAPMTDRAAASYAIDVAHAGKTLAKQPNRERARHTPLVVILLKRTLLRALMNRLQIVNELIIERYRGLNRKVIRL